MSTTTPNFGLIKPELSDPADITALNENWEKIDEKLKELGEGGAKSIVVEDTLVADNWGANIYTWVNESITSADQMIELLPSNTITAEQLEALQMANIVGYQQEVGNVTFKAYGDVPLIDIPVIFIVRGDE